MSVEVHQVARPHGFPQADQFQLVSTPTPVPAAGEALVENIYLSVDPYMREVMDFGDLNAPMEGRSIGRVIASEIAGLDVGELVFHRRGWRSDAIVTAADYRVLPQAAGVPVSAYLGILGGTGLSAYVGLTQIARVQPGETVFISAAAGAVGGAAGQLAKLLGAGRVIGSASSAAKISSVFDAALGYKDGDLAGQLAAAAPDGIDVYFDNVGGDHLEAALSVLRDRGRIAWCGAVSQYNSVDKPVAPHNLYEVVGKQLRLEGFLVRDYLHLRPRFEDFLTPHIRRGQVPIEETIVDGLPNMPDAFLTMLSGGNVGKMVVRL